MRLDEALHIRLSLGKTRHNLDDATIRCVEQLQARHLPLIDWTGDNTEERQIYFHVEVPPAKTS
ncbi:hypothetical protein [Streptomyces noursei]|uniref:hypothetical protein n=1 Tax=Streptomyces noursei TaxID=1971 RepID=UPI00045EE5AB|nr:hypothetical protein [Streptomyces noursei]AIA06585.1 hypothetical protein DC74_6144 [Streptomyces noursei]